MAEAKTQAGAAGAGPTGESGAPEAVERLASEGNVLLFHHPERDVAALAGEAAARRGGFALALKAGIKPVKPRADQAPPGRGEVVVAAWSQLKDEAWRAALGAAQPALLFLPDAEQGLEALKSIGRGTALLHELWARAGTPPVLAASSFASPPLAESLGERFESGEFEVRYLEYFRGNVMFEVLATGDETRKRRMALRIATELPGPGLYYCATVKAAKDLHEALAAGGVESVLLHPQQRAPDRALAREDFVHRRAHVLVTSMFPGEAAARGARYCVHADLPAGLDQYYYEACSTGPVDKPARAILLYARADYAKQLADAEAKDPTPAEALAVLAAVRDQTALRGGADVAAMGDAAGLAAKKARLVAGLLKDAGLLAETRGKLRPAEASNEKAAAAAVTAFRRRRELERRRFHEVVNYAETGICRVKVLLRHFGREDVEPCGLCDNCRKGKEDRARKVARTRSAAHTGAQHRRWSRGDLVSHATWGEGEVKQVWGDKLRVHFPGLGEKVLKAEFVKPA